MVTDTISVLILYTYYSVDHHCMMMEKALSRDTSPSGDRSLSECLQLSSRIVGSPNESHIDTTPKQTLSGSRTSLTKKAKRVRFFRNGDKFYTGVVMAVTPERYRSFDSLATDLTRALMSNVTLPNGVRAIYSMDGKKVQDLIELEDGKCYVVASQGEVFKKVEYSSTKVRHGSSLSGLPQSPNVRQINAIPVCVRARIITLIRHGTKPRRVLRLLLNKRNAASLDHVMEAITEVVKLDCGAVRRVYTLTGRLVITLDQFFENEDIFLAYGSDKSTQEDFELDTDESKYVQSFRKGPWVSKRQGGPMPVMPRKTGKRSITAPQVRTPSPSIFLLPQPLRLHYTVGHVIGDGNFAVVRHCIHKQTGAEYAIKIVDKYKCQGKETMLASEVSILRQVCHPNIISLIAEKETADQLFLVMELVTGGDLFDAIAAVTKVSEAEASVMITHLTSALAYLHSHCIVHRDVKPENLLVEMEGSKVRCLKLADFGLAQVVHEPMYTVCGTPTYVAPEILEETGYGLKIDVWAAGVILYILLCGFPPFVSRDNDQEELFERILSGQYEFTPPYWDPISDSAKQLISNMLQSQPELRFSAEDVLDHPWLVSFLGGDQSTAGASTIGESSQQHRNQQCQSLRMATFEFDYKYQRSLCDDDDDADVTIIPQSSFGHVHHENEIAQVSGNSNCEELISLSADCLQDIRALTTSLNNIVNNMFDNNESSKKISTNMATSLSSIPKKVQSTMKNNNGGCTDQLSLNLHSVNKRNGNSLSDIHSSGVVTHCYDHGRLFNPSKSVKNSSKHELKSQSKALLNVNVNDMTKNARDDDKNISIAPKHLSVSRLSHSIDGLIGNSDNNIESSDSFVNIKFENTVNEASSSMTKSMKSTDNLKGGHLMQRLHFEKSSETEKLKHSSGKSISANRRSRFFESNASKIPRMTHIPAQTNGQQTCSRVFENIKQAQSEVFDVKSPVKMNVQTTKREQRNKRFSCALQYPARHNPELYDANSANYGSMSNGRKCSSTDELRDDLPKPSAKTNRFSLYYTPQLARKSYEPSNIAAKSTKIKSSKSSRPTSWKICPESAKTAEEIAEIRRTQSRNRRLPLDTKTVTSNKK